MSDFLLAFSVDAGLDLGFVRLGLFVLELPKEPRIVRRSDEQPEMAAALAEAARNARASATWPTLG